MHDDALWSPNRCAVQAVQHAAPAARVRIWDTPALYAVKISVACCIHSYLMECTAVYIQPRMLHLHMPKKTHLAAQVLIYAREGVSAEELVRDAAKRFSIQLTHPIEVMSPLLQLWDGIGVSGWNYGCMCKAAQPLLTGCICAAGSMQ